LVRLRIDLAYDGSGFRGFARQPDQRTVQGVLEDALSLFYGVAVTTTGAGRTDAGVHASAQVVHVDVPADARNLDDLSRARGALDHLCGPDVTIWRVRRVPASFDARFSATQRRYRYRLCDAVAMDPLWRVRTWHVGPPTLDVAAMEEGGANLVGEHVFASFCRKREGDALVRRIDRVAVRRGAAGLVVVGVDGASFCHQMVRSVVGTLVEVGAGRQEPAWVAKVLDARDRSAAGPVAPPHGLVLTHVRY
jgi:tRNA pseudouridine38-40 synthase